MNLITIDIDKFESEIDAQEIKLSEDEWLSIIVSLKRAGVES